MFALHLPHPLSVRNLFYQLLSDDGSGVTVEKSESAYQKVGRLKTLLCRDGSIPWHYFADSSRASYDNDGFEGLGDTTFVDRVASLYRRDYWETTGIYPQLWVESRSLSPTLAGTETKGRTLTQRYAALLEHYGLQATRTNPRSSHENGVAEQAHYRLKTALAQALIIRGSRDFPSVAGYSAFVQGVVDKSNRRVQGKLDVERPYLRSLPQAAVPEYTTWRTKVKKWSTIRVTNKTYSVPSRLCGHEVKVHQYADYLEVYYKDHMVERLERVRGEHKSRIDYRHIIWSLVRKPGAFARYRFREHLFPTPVFRQAYDALGRWHGGRTDVEYVRILHLAASTLEARVERALSQLLLTGRSFDYATVQELAAPTPPQIPQLPSLSAPDLKVYDALL